MRADFSIGVNWRSWTDGNLSPAEAATACDLDIRAGGEALTRNIDGEGRTRESVLVSALPFSWWLCANFWRICHEPGLPRNRSVPIGALENWRMAHCLTAIGDGYAWPEITFTADGNEMRIQCREQDGDARKSQPLRYVAGLDAICPRERFIEEALGLIGATAARAGDTEPDFIAAWNQLEEEYANEDVANYRALEAMLGHDTGYAPETLMARIGQANQRIGWDACRETASGLNPVYGVEFASQAVDLERALSGMSAGVTARVELPRMEMESLLPWEAGRRLARRAREIMGLEPEKPLPRAKLLEWMGLTASRFNRIATAGPVGISRVKGREAALVFPSRGAGKYATSRLFQLARALGGLLSLPADARCLVMSQSQTADQQIQRNFAAELVAPIAAVTAMLPERPAKKDIEAVSRHFQASPRTLIHSLVNQGFLDVAAGNMLLA